MWAQANPPPSHGGDLPSVERCTPLDPALHGCLPLSLHALTRSLSESADAALLRCLIRGQPLTTSHRFVRCRSEEFGLPSFPFKAGELLQDFCFSLFYQSTTFQKVVGLLVLLLSCNLTLSIDVSSFLISQSI